MIEKIKAEIENMKSQQKLHMELYHQANGAIASLEWVLAQLEEPAMTEKQFIEAIDRAN